MRYYIHGFTIEADSEQEAQIVADELVKEDKQIYEIIEERDKNDNGIRHSWEEVKSKREKLKLKKDGKLL
jgi:tRNA A22 N-methylase